MGEFREDLDFPFPEIRLICGLQLFPHADDLPVVELLLLTFHMCVPQLLKLLRQVFQDFTLLPPQNEGRHHPAKPPARLLIPGLYDRRLDPRSEFFEGIQEPRHQKIENTPKLREPVLDRRPCQGITRIRADKLQGLRRCGIMILDILGFIRYEEAELRVLIH